MLSFVQNNSKIRYYNHLSDLMDNYLLIAFDNLQRCYQFHQHTRICMPVLQYGYVKKKQKKLSSNPKII